jgi:hypothetical protein
MPVSQGNVAGSFMVLPEKAQNIVSAGIPLFELRKPDMSWNSCKDFGLWNVSVREEIHPTRHTLIFRKNWFKGHTAYVEYFPNKKGFLFGFCPDDPFWHNRIILCKMVDSTAATIIERYHTINGTLPGRRLLEELRILRDHIYEYCTVAGDKVVHRSRDKNECIEVGDKLVSSDKIDRYTVESQRTEEIQRLAKRFGSNWIVSQAFQSEVRPEVEKKIAVLGAPRVGSGLASDQVIDLFKQMSPTDRAVMRSILLSEESSDVAVHQSATPEPNEETPLSECDYNTLRRIAKSRNITTANLKKPQLLAEIERVLAEEKEATGNTGETVETGNPYEGMNDALDEEEIT